MGGGGDKPLAAVGAADDAAAPGGGSASASLLAMLMPGLWRGCCQAPRGRAADAENEDESGFARPLVAAADGDEGALVGISLASASPSSASAPSAPKKAKGAAADRAASGGGANAAAALGGTGDGAASKKPTAPKVAAGSGAAAAAPSAGGGEEAASSSKASAPAAGEGRKKAQVATPSRSSSAGAGGGTAKAKAKSAAGKASTASKAAATPAAGAGTGAGQPAPAPAEHACPGQRMANKVSYLQKVKDERKRQDERAKEMSKLVDDMLAGKFKKEGGGQPGGNMLIKMPTPYERENTRKLMLEGFRVQYRKLGRSSADPALVAAPATQQYSAAETAGLAIEGGHQHMPRPTDVKLPKDFRKKVGVMPAKRLAEHDCKAERKLLSVYGDIFDVSDRPDKYGPDGPYSWMTGHDLTWGFVSGKDVPEMNDKYYDMWKIAPEEFREKKLQGLLAWVAFYEHEYGGAVGRLEEYQKEVGLKGPPMEQAEECCIM